MSAARPDSFVRNTIQLLEVGAIPAAYGWAKEKSNCRADALAHELIEGVLALAGPRDRSCDVRCDAPAAGGSSCARRRAS